MTKKCEYCQNMYPDNLSACPVCGSHKFIELEEVEKEQKSIERKAERRRTVFSSVKFILVGIILWAVLFFAILFSTIGLGAFNVVEGGPNYGNVAAVLLIVAFFGSIYVGFRISYQLTFKKKKT